MIYSGIVIVDLINKSDLSITGPTPNLTRDSVEGEVVYEKLKFKIFDTAGFSKRNSDKVNELYASRSRQIHDFPTPPTVHARCQLQYSNHLTTPHPLPHTQKRKKAGESHINHTLAMHTV